MISILITNHNKEKFLNKNLTLLYKSSYKNFEVILFDDVSTDNSLKKLKKFNKIKLIKNKKKKYKSPGLNQIYGIKKTLRIAKGEIICLLDADDYFIPSKMETINNFFKKNKKSNCVYNFPFAKINKFKFKNKSNNQIWPTIFPTSCISIRKNLLMKYFKFLKPKYFPNLEIDARLIILMKYYFNEYNIINKKLTIYNEDQFGITAGVVKYSRKWWFRRYEAFEYLQYVLGLKKKKLRISLDRIITFGVYNFFKILL